MSKLKEELLNLIKIANGIKAGQVTHKLAEIEDIIKKEKDLYAKEKLKECKKEIKEIGEHYVKFGEAKAVEAIDMVLDLFINSKK